MPLRVLAEYPRVKLKNALFCLSILRGENFKKKCLMYIETGARVFRTIHFADIQ